MDPCREESGDLRVSCALHTSLRRVRQRTEVITHSRTYCKHHKNLPGLIRESMKISLLLSTQYFNYGVVLLRYIRFKISHFFLKLVVCLCCRGVRSLPVAVLLIQSLFQMDGPCILAKETIPMCFLEWLLVSWLVD